MNKKRGCAALIDPASFDIHSLGPTGGRREGGAAIIAAIITKHKQRFDFARSAQMPHKQLCRYCYIEGTASALTFHMDRWIE